jgi:hypothetical protein
MNDKPKKGLFFPVLFAIAVILLVVLAWHVLFPLLAVGVVVTLGLWLVIVISVVLISLGVLLLFLLPSIFIGLIALIVLGWVIFAIVIFPFLFPLLAPLLIILLVLSYLMGRGRRS